ncbi:MAG: S8 family serine peptidase, partial [bacterium]
MRRSTTAACALLVFLCAAAVQAEFPYPANLAPCPGQDGDPPCIEATAFAEYLFLSPGVLPNDYIGDSVWKYTSGTTGNPAIDASAQELFGVTGASVDLAWQTTTGRPDVVIAVLDSGIRWAERFPDLVNKYYLNRAELPVPEGSDNPRDAYDRNGDGVFNLADYLADGTHAADSRVSDQNGNGVIDPEDLIFIFSDGVDADENGYIDDISGWDFFEDDNDALDEVRYGHGTGEAHDSTAEANNGSGFPGSCPNCRIMPVRVGDSFVTEVNHFAQGVTFAVDSGARVVQEALGTLNQSAFGQQAIDYAYAHGVVVIASAADEEAQHHNYPANYNHTVQVNSVTKFGDVSGIKQSPESYLYLNGCTNYGAHIALAVPSSSCSSEATGRSAGVAGLINSAALNAIDRGMLQPYPRDDGTPAPFPLSAEEVKQILTLTADDINFDARADVSPPLPQNYATAIGVPGINGSERFPSIAGFDEYFGYGRLNADTAVLRVASGQIPPEVSIAEPAWFSTYDPAQTPTLPIRGRVAANRAASFRYTLEAAPGVQPAEADFITMISADDLTQPISELGNVDLERLRGLLPNGATGPAVHEDGSPDPDRFTITIRVRAIDDAGNVAEDRRAIAVHSDTHLLAGFPHALGADGASAPVTVDLDGDGIEEIVLGDSNGFVHAFRADLSEVPGWPVQTDPLEIGADAAAFVSGAIAAPVHSSILGAVSVGDLDRDGSLEVVASDLQGRVYVWQRNGTRRAGFPVKTLPEYSFSFRSEREIGTPDGQVPDRTNRHTAENRLGRAVLGGVALGNLDSSADGSLEIVASAFDRHVYAWHADGSAVVGWPVLLKDPAKVASVDPLTNEVTLIAGAGGRLGTKLTVPPSLGDLDGDGEMEVVAAANEEYVEPPNAVFDNAIVRLFQQVGVLDSGNTRVYALHADGVAHGDSGMTKGWNPDAFVAGWPVKTALLTTELLPTVGTGSNGSPALVDLDGDGTLEIATMSAIGPVYVFRHDGVGFFGRHLTGEDITLETEALGSGSNSIDKPFFGGLGALAVAEFMGPDQGFQLLAPTAGFGKLIDNQVPARQIPAEDQLTVWRLSAADGAPADRQVLDAFPRVVNDLQFLAGPSVADLDNDSEPEALAGTGV